MYKELLEQVFANEVLTEETRAAMADTLEKAITEAVATQVAEERVKIEEEVKVQMAAQFAADREALIEALDTKVEEMLKEELAELAGDISDFRDLEVEYANRMVEERAKLQEAVEKDMQELVERLDTFLEMRLSEEVNELKESIEEVRKNNLGRKIFEAFKGELEAFVSVDSGVDALQAQLDEANAALAAKAEELKEAQKAIEANDRKVKLEETLSSLQNRPREIMEAILATVETDKLQETYDKFIDRVLHESVTKSSEKESGKSDEATPVLAEGKTDETTDKVEEATKVVTGDSEQLDESAKANVPAPKSEAALRLQRLAGIVH